MRQLSHAQVPGHSEHPWKPPQPRQVCQLSRAQFHAWGKHSQKPS